MSTQERLSGQNRDIEALQYLETQVLLPREKIVWKGRPDAVESATGERPALPARLSDLLDRPKHCQTLANDLDQLKNHIETTLS